jgi:hypothetical protein
VAEKGPIEQTKPLDGRVCQLYFVSMEGFTPSLCAQIVPTVCLFGRFRRCGWLWNE